MQPPSAPRDERSIDIHGETIRDEYGWMADTDDPRLHAYLSAENDYATTRTAHLTPLVNTLVTEIAGRIRQTDLAVPVRHDRWWYYTRTVDGASYPIDARVLYERHPQRPTLDGGGVLDGEQILLDHNAAAEGQPYFAVGALEVSPDGSRLGYAVDVVGDERYDLRIVDIDTGTVLDDAVRGIGDGLAWSLDGRHVFYTRVDASFRSDQVWRHTVGSDPAADDLVFDEPDARFWVALGASRDDRVVVVTSAARTSTEVWLLDAARPTDPPRLVAARRDGFEYSVEPVEGGCYVVHNANRPNGELAWAPTGSENEQGWVPLPVMSSEEYLTDVEAFDGFVALALRRDGSTRVRVLPRDPAHPDRLGEGHDIALAPVPGTITAGSTPRPDSPTLQVACESASHPPRVYDYDPATRSADLLKEVQVPAGHDPARYVERRDWATAPDGTAVPLTIVHRADLAPDGSHPGLLYGYGAYGISLDPVFSVPTLSLLDRGVVVAVAHVRGGAELGRDWYEQARGAGKPHSFSDFVACADRLVETGWVGPDRLAAQGGSAGGLLVGAVANQAPDRFRAIHAQVPFVDVLTSMLDEDLPLTTLETLEWGDPIRDVTAYRTIAGYCPYRNVGRHRYPALLVTANLHDTRVLVTEPAKWVARLRDRASNDPEVAPILLRTELEAGHAGRSGRYAAWREIAWEMAVLLDWLDAAEPGSSPSA